MNSNNAGTRTYNDHFTSNKTKQGNYDEVDIDRLRKEKETIEKEASYFKEHYHKLQINVDDLLTMVRESSQNKKELKHIIEQKDKIISELKGNTSSGTLREEILNATDKLAQEKKQCLKLQTKLNEVTDDLKNCNNEKFLLSKKLEQIQSDMRRYEMLQEKLNMMVDKQGQLERHFKRNEEALRVCTIQRDTLQKELNEAKKFIEVELSKIKSEKINQVNDSQQNYIKELETIKRELQNFKNKNENLLEQIQLKDKLEHELKQKIITLTDTIKANKELEENISRSRTLATCEDQKTISKLNTLVENYKSENLKLTNDIAELNKRVSNIETISRNLKSELKEKEIAIKEKRQENEELHEKISSMSDENKELEQTLRRKLQHKFNEKLSHVKEFSEEKEKKLMEQLNTTKIQLHESTSRQHALIAENSAQIAALENKISMQEQEIIKCESEKFTLLEDIKHFSINKNSFDLNIETIKNQLAKVTQERDEKTQVILDLRKMSQQMQSYADQSREEKKQIYKENDLLREKAFEAQSRLEALMSEQESQKNEISILQQKIVELDKNYSFEKAKLKKIEIQLKQELAETQSQCTAAIAEKNKLFYEKEMTLKNLQECEKCLAKTNTELGFKKSELKKLQGEQADLNGKISEYRDKIMQFDKETDKLLQERQNYNQSILTLEQTVKSLEKEVVQKNDIITELSCNNELLKAKSSEHQQIENEFKELKTIKKVLSQQNSDLKSKCTSLDDDLDTLKHEFKVSQKNIEIMQKKNKKLEALLQKSSQENSSLRKAAEEYENLEKGNSTLNNKCNSLSLTCDKLNAELSVVRKELIQSREKQSKLEEEVKSWKDCEVVLRQNCSHLEVTHEDLVRELSKEKEKQAKLVEEIEILKNKDMSIASDNERLCKENAEANKIISNINLKIDDLQTINAELVQKCCDFESKELTYEKEIEKRTEELKLNIEEYTSLKGKYEVLGPKLAKYVSQYKLLKQKNTELQEIIDKSTNNEKETTGLKQLCQNMEIELSKLKLENDKLNGEINLKKSQPERFQQRQDGPHRLKADVKSTQRIKLPTGEDDPVYHLDTLVGQVRQSNSPAAKHLLNSCKHIKDLIFKERGVTIKQ